MVTSDSENKVIHVIERERIKSDCRAIDRGWIVNNEEELEVLAYCVSRGQGVVTEELSGAGDSNLKILSWIRVRIDNETPVCGVMLHVCWATSDLNCAIVATLNWSDIESVRVRGQRARTDQVIDKVELLSSYIEHDFARIDNDRNRLYSSYIWVVHQINFDLNRVKADISFVCRVEDELVSGVN